MLPPRDEPRHCGVIGKLHNGGTVMNMGAVVCVEGVEQGTEHTALGEASAGAKGRGCVMAHYDSLSAAREEAADPPACGKREPEVPLLDHQLLWEDCLE